MSKQNAKRYSLENINKSSSTKQKEKQSKIYPNGMYKTCSSLSLSSLSLSLSQNSIDSSFSDSSFSDELDQNIALALGVISSSQKKNVSVAKNEEGFRRCNWITKNSDDIYVQFHDECWGVPAYYDHQLFELLSFSGMLMDFNWTDILRRKELFREAFAGFNVNKVAKMGKKEIMKIASDKALLLPEGRVRCIVNNAQCTVNIVKEFGSFSNYMWNYVSYKPIISRYKYSRNVPLRSSKAEAISKDLLKRGFRLAGPVIVHSFMQAAGMRIDHLVDCIKYNECINLAERPWRHV